MGGFKCKVTNSISNTPLAAPKSPVWCEGNPSNCTKGAKQILAWHQQTGTNIEVTGNDLAGDRKSPAYNSKCGFANGEFVKVFFFVFLSFFLVGICFSNGKETGAQNDIFEYDKTADTVKAVVNSPPKAPRGSSRSLNSNKRWADDDTNIVEKSTPITDVAY